LNSIINFDITLLLAALNSAMGISALLRILVGRSSSGPSCRSTLWLWLTMSGLVTAGTVYAPDRGIAGEAAMKFVLLNLFPVSAALIVATDVVAIRRFLWTFAGLGMFLTITGVLSISMLETTGQRLTVLDSNPILLASGAMCFPLVGWTFLWRTAPWSRLLVILLTLVCVSVAASAARGPTIAAAIALTILLLFQARKRLLKLPLVAAGIIVAGLVLPTYLPTVAVTRLESLVSSVPALAGDGDKTIDGDVAIRLSAFKFALGMFERSPLVGNGTASFAAETEDDWELGSIDHPHNLPLQVAAEYGVVGLLVLAALFARPIQTWFQLAADPAWMGVIALHIMFTLLSLESFGLDTRVLWALTLMVRVAPRAVDREHNPASGVDLEDRRSTDVGRGDDKITSIVQIHSGRGGLQAARARITVVPPQTRT